MVVSGSPSSAFAGLEVAVSVDVNQVVLDLKEHGQPAVLTSLLQRGPVQIFQHVGYAPWCSGGVVSSDKASCSTLDILKGLDLT